MIKKRYFLFFLMAISVGLFFQNCSQVNLEKVVPSVSPHAVKGEVNICLENELSHYTVETVVISNLNLAFSKENVLEDSDSDGIADVDEELFGFDLLNRRSNGKVLDSICLDVSGGSDCVNSIPNCSASENILGLNQCDVKTLRLDTLFGHPTQGLDTDKDGIVDLMEILWKTSPNINDKYEDPDHDGILNWMEFLKSSNPNFANRSMDQKKLLEYSTKQVVDSADCNGEHWKVEIKQIPLATVNAYEDNSDSASLKSPALSHEQDENVITIFTKLKTRSGYSGNSKIYFKDFKINRKISEIYFQWQDFKAAGDVLP